MHGNMSVKFTFTIFTTEEPHDKKAGEYHSIALFNKAHTVIERRCGSGRRLFECTVRTCLAGCPSKQITGQEGKIEILEIKEFHVIVSDYH